MRFVIGCSLSLIFFASYAYAQASTNPDRSSGKARAERQTVRDEPEMDYGPLLKGAIESRNATAPTLGDEASGSWSKPAAAEAPTVPAPVAQREALVTAEAQPPRRLQRVEELLEDISPENPPAETSEQTETIFEIDLPNTNGM